MKNMTCRLVGNIVLVIHNSQPPTSAEWSGYVELTARTGEQFRDLSKTKQLVFTDGGGPNAAQRKQVTDTVNQYIGSKQTPIAVVSNSSLVRGIVTAFNWLNSNMRTFAPEAVEEAFQFLELTPDEVAKVWRTIEETTRDISGGVPKSVIRPAPAKSIPPPPSRARGSGGGPTV